MPLFVYYKAQNHLGYGSAIHYTPHVNGNGEHLNKNIFQSHKITDGEAAQGMAWLCLRYKVRVRVKAICIKYKDAAQDWELL